MKQTVEPPLAPADAQMVAVKRAMAFLSACVDVGELHPTGAENPCDLWCALKDAFGLPEPDDHSSAPADVMQPEAGPIPPMPEILGQNEATRKGWNAFFQGKGRYQCPFPHTRSDLQKKWLEGWMAAQQQGGGA